MERKRKIEDSGSESEEDREVEKFEKKMRREMDGDDEVEEMYDADDQNTCKGCRSL